jgi:flagellin-specific chaperone FliS
MSALTAYRQQQQANHWTRIDLVLALYDGAIERLDRALSALQAGDEIQARGLLGRVQAIVVELAAGIHIDAGDPNSANLLRLYEYFAHTLAGTELSKLTSVRKSLAMLREGFRAIRPEALSLERMGTIPSLDGPRLILAVG